MFAFIENAVLDRNDLLGLSFGFLGPSSGTTGEISLASNEREPGKDVWFAVFGDEQFNVRRKINYKLCTCSDNNNHGGGRHIQKAFDYYSERKPCSWMYFGQSYFGEGVKMEYAELISMDYPDSKGTIEVEIQILPLGVKPTNVEIWSAEKAGIDAEIEGFGTEKRSGYGDSSSTHGIRNYIIKDKDWRPSTTIATVKFVILADCGDMPMLKERPVVTGNWTLNGKGWRRMVGNLGGQRGEGITLPVKGE